MSHPSPYQPGGPDDRAFQLLQRITTEEEFTEYVERGRITVTGRWAKYQVHRSGEITIYKDGQSGSACMYPVETTAWGAGGAYTSYGELPRLDWIIASYIVLKRRERFFWETACFSTVSYPNEMRSGSIRRNAGPTAIGTGREITA